MTQGSSEFPLALLAPLADLALTTQRQGRVHHGVSSSLACAPQRSEGDDGGSPLVHDQEVSRLSSVEVLQCSRREEKDRTIFRCMFVAFRRLDQEQYTTTLPHMTRSVNRQGVARSESLKVSRFQLLGGLLLFGQELDFSSLGSIKGWRSTLSLLHPLRSLRLTSTRTRLHFTAGSLVLDDRPDMSSEPFPFPSPFAEDPN